MLDPILGCRVDRRSSFGGSPLPLSSNLSLASSTASKLIIRDRSVTSVDSPARWRYRLYFLGDEPVHRSPLKAIGHFCTLRLSAGDASSMSGRGHVIRLRSTERATLITATVCVRARSATCSLSQYRRSSPALRDTSGRKTKKNTKNMRAIAKFVAADFFWRSSPCRFGDGYRRPAARQRIAAKSLSGIGHD